MFAPELWGEVSKFKAIASAKYSFRGVKARALNGVAAHFDKANIFLGIAKSWIPRLEVDEIELDANGFSAAQNARELAALVEGVFLELYSSIDCCVEVLHLVYSDTSRGFALSTSKMFQNPMGITGSFPEQLKPIVQSASWFHELRKFRDELTHWDVGHCSRNRETGKITYFHPILSDQAVNHTVEDIFGWLEQKVDSVDAFLGSAFHVMNTTITSGHVRQICGMVEGRMLERILDLSKPINFDNGSCLSRHWFEVDGNPKCPFLHDCKAYDRPATTDDVMLAYGVVIKPSVDEVIGTS